MWPWAHAALGYLLYTVYLRFDEDLPPTGPAAIVLGVGTQLPDLIDKTGGWYLYVLPSGRSLAHSVWFAALVVAVVTLYVRRRGYHGLDVPFAIGYLAGLLGDTVRSVLALELQNLTFLVWPFLPLPEYGIEKSVWAHLLALNPDPFFVFGVILTFVALVLWRRHGYPGLGTLWQTGRAMARLSSGRR